MTFDKNPFLPSLGAALRHSHLTDETQLKSHVGIQTSLPSQNSEICHEQDQTAFVENESGIRPDFPDSYDRNDSRNLSELEAHLHRAQSCFDAQNIESAVQELAAATERLNVYQNLVDTAMDAAILKLTTLGGPAASPHPQALSLIKIRNSRPA